MVDLNRNPGAEQSLVVMALVSVGGHRDDLDIDEASFRNRPDRRFRAHIRVQNYVGNSIPNRHLGTNESPPASRAAVEVRSALLRSRRSPEPPHHTSSRPAKYPRNGRRRWFFPKR
jgi:hypothetical protein